MKNRRALHLLVLLFYLIDLSLSAADCPLEGTNSCLVILIGTGLLF